MLRSKQDFIEYYNSLTTDELLEIKSKDTLEEEAKEALEEVFTSRGVNSDEEIKDFVIENYSRTVSNRHLLAPLVARFCAKLLDSVISWLLFFIPSILVGHNSEFRSSIVLMGIVAFLIFILFKDSLPNGQSPGKSFMGIKVINEISGNPCSPSESFFRNLALLLGIIDWAFILGERKKRLGDFIAGTIVIQSSK